MGRVLSGSMADGLGRSGGGDRRIDGQAPGALCRSRCPDRGRLSHPRTNPGRVQPPLCCQLASLRDWEQRRFSPDPTARTYLTIIDRDRETVENSHPRTASGLATPPTPAAQLREPPERYERTDSSNAPPEAGRREACSCSGKYPPAEPGALGLGPLETAVRVADAALYSLAT